MLTQRKHNFVWKRHSPNPAVLRECFQLRRMNTLSKRIKPIAHAPLLVEGLSPFNPFVEILLLRIERRARVDDSH